MTERYCPNCERPLDEYDLLFSHDSSCDLCSEGDEGIAHCGCFYDSEKDKRISTQIIAGDWLMKKKEK